MAQEPGIFAGLKVIDFASFIAGPAATTVLSDFGADVIKVESPGGGDPYRNLYRVPPNPKLDTNYTWQLTNRNKRSLVFNLKDPKAKDILARLVKWADVLVTNFPPKVRRSLGLEYETLSQLNDRLIFADITGYGETGPEANKPGFDITAYWARSGLMQYTRDASAPPAVPVPGIGDHATAISLYAAIVTGLYRRERTGKGGNVSTSLIANGAWATATWLQAALDGAKFSGEIDRNHPPSAIVGASYQTSDKRWLLLAFIEEAKNWPVFAKAIGREDLLADSRFADTKTRNQHATDLVAELDRSFSQQPLQYWKTLLDAQTLPYGVVQIPEDILTDPQLWANNIIIPVDDGGKKPRYTVDSPFTVNDTEKVKPRIAPEVGEHSGQILQELGYSQTDIDGFREAGTIPRN